MTAPNIHLPGEPVAGEVQFCTRCAIVLIDVSEGWASSDGTGPSFWAPGQPIFRENGFSMSLEFADPDRDTSDEVQCTA